MLHASTQKLIHKLCALTQSGDIAWREGEGDTLIFDTEGYRVEVHAEPPLVRLLGADGKELETAAAADLAATPWPDGEGTFASHVSEMTRQALRAARGADVAISKILSSLSAPPQKTPEPPPSPHTIPDPPLQPPRAETAVSKLFAANQAAVVEVIESAPVEPEAEPAIEAAEEELPLEDAPEPARPALAEPQFKIPVFKTQAPPQHHAAVRDGFGAVKSFAVAPWIRPEPQSVELPRAPVQVRPAQPQDAEPPFEPKVTSTGLFISGVGALTRQTVREESPAERAAPPPAPGIQPPAPEAGRERAPAIGPDIYKPWT